MNCLNKISFAIFIILIATIFSGGQIRPQPPIPPPIVGATQEAQLHRTAVYNEARGNFEGALTIYRQLRVQYRQSHNTPAYYRGELNCLLNLKKYGEAEMLIKQELTSLEAKSFPGMSKMDLSVDLGEVYFLQGKEGEAWVAWNGAIAENIDSPQAYRGISEALMLARQVDKAVEVLKRGEARLGEQVMALDLARAYTALMDFGNATKSYLTYLKFQPEQYYFVERSIYNFPESEETAKVVIDALKTAEKVPEAEKILAGYLFSLGKYQDALKYTIRVDKDGRELANIAETLKGEGHCELALTAYEAIMEKYPASPLKSQVFSGEAECYARMGNLEQALKLYRTVIEGYPHSNFCETSLYRIGEILLEQLNLPDSAGFYFEWVKREFFNGVYGGKAGLALGECAVVAGNLPLAIGRYREMTGKAYLKQAEIVSEANLRLGRCFLWAEQADSAMTVWEELARKYPTSDAANDALNDILCIKETEDKNAVSAFAQAWYSAERRQYEAALKDFRALMERFPGTVIAGRSCVEAGNVLTKFQGAEFALSFIEDYINKNTEVKLKDQIYYQMGEICLNVLKEPVRARVYFEKLLVEMPDSPLAPVVRRKMEEKLLINL